MRDSGPATRLPTLYKLGQELGATQLLGAMYQRDIVTRNVGQIFSHYDVLLTPALPNPPPAIGQYNEGQDALDGRGWMARVFDHSPFTAVFNVSGCPAMTMPLAQDSKSGLPIGMQFGAGDGREDMLLQLAAQLEHALPWNARRPAIWAGNQ